MPLRAAGVSNGCLSGLLFEYRYSVFVCLAGLIVCLFLAYLFGRSRIVLSTERSGSAIASQGQIQ